MILLILKGLVVLTAVGLVLAGRRVIRRTPPLREPSPGVSWPKVAVVVPAAGAIPQLPEVVSSLLSQDYPAFDLVFVTRDAEDPASSVIEEHIAGHPRARHITSGAASGCGQKNHNLLRGLASLAHKPPVLVFCDGTRKAPPLWLKALVAPVARGDAAVSSGYHHGMCLDRRISTLGHAFSILLLYLTKGVSVLNQPWGGGTAVTREVFERLGVERAWSRNIVDDVSLAALLRKHRIPVASGPGAHVLTPLKGETPGSWLHWLFRQWFYLKVCMPGHWLAAGLVCHAFSALLIWSALQAVALLPGWVTPLEGLSGLGFLLGVAAFALLLRTLHPAPGPVLRWLAAACLTVPAAAWAHVLTLGTMEITWQGIRYRVTWEGIVKG